MIDYLCPSSFLDLACFHVSLVDTTGGPVRVFPPTVVIFVHGHGDFFFGFFAVHGHVVAQNTMELVTEVHTSSASS